MAASGPPGTTQSDKPTVPLASADGTLAQAQMSPCNVKPMPGADPVQACFESATALLISVPHLPSSGNGADAQNANLIRLKNAAADLSDKDPHEHQAAKFSGFDSSRPALWMQLLSTSLTVLSWCLLVPLLFKAQQMRTENAELSALLGTIRQREREAGSARETYEKLREKYEALSSQARISQLAEEAMANDPVQDSYSPGGAESSREPHSAPAPLPARDSRSDATSFDFTEDSFQVQDDSLAAEAIPSKYKSIPMPEAVPASYQSSGDPLADYSHARSLGSADGADWFRGKHSCTSLSCRNLDDLKLNPAARLSFERAGRGDFLALDQNGRMSVFPSFSLDLASSRAFLEGVFLYTDGGPSRVARAATVESSGDEWILKQAGEITGG